MLHQIQLLKISQIWKLETLTIIRSFLDSFLLLKNHLWRSYVALDLGWRNVIWVCIQNFVSFRWIVYRWCVVYTGDDGRVIDRQSLLLVISVPTCTCAIARISDKYVNNSTRFLNFCTDKRLRLQLFVVHTAIAITPSSNSCRSCEKIKPNFIRIASHCDHSIIVEYSDYLAICPSDSDVVTCNYPVMQLSPCKYHFILVSGRVFKLLTAS